jgi:hypothetical protein
MTQPVFRLHPNRLQPDRISKPLKPAFSAIRDKIKNNPDLENVELPESEDDLAHFLLEKEIHEYIRLPVQSTKQDRIRNAIDEAIKENVSAEDLSMIVRFVLYAVMLSENDYYNRLMDAFQKPEEAISKDIIPIGSKAKRKKRMQG